MECQRGFVDSSKRRAAFRFPLALTTPALLRTMMKLGYAIETPGPDASATGAELRRREQTGLGGPL